MSNEAKQPTTNEEGRALVRQTMHDAELARRLGISRTAIGKWGEIPPNRVTQVAEATGLAPEWIRPKPYG